MYAPPVQDGAAESGHYNIRQWPGSQDNAHLGIGDIEVGDDWRYQRGQRTVDDAKSHI